MTPHETKSASVGVSLAAIALFSGCSIKESLKFDRAVAVKIPVTGSRTEPKQNWSANGWTFQFIARSPQTDKYQPLSDWYLAREKNPSQAAPKTAGAHWRFAEHHAPNIADAVYSKLRVYPLMMEPNQVFHVNEADKPMPTIADDMAQPCGPGEVVVSSPPSRFWPSIKRDGVIQPLFHRDENHTQLAKAYETVKSQPRSQRGNPVRIGFLDTGFSNRHATAPLHVEESTEADAVARFGCGTDACSRPSLPGDLRASHGTGTIGLLAGQKINLKPASKGNIRVAGYDGFLGAAPDATIVPVRVANNVFSLATSNLAYAIDYASRKKNCDVISMSHGGAPSQVWVDAVNAAYERGTAMFSACGNFYSISGMRGLLVPSTPVYPAAFYRVVGVTGVTPEGKTYAKNPIHRLLFGLKNGYRGVGNYFMRGSYGGDGSARSWTRDVDGSRRLRNNPIAAYTPNVPWADSSQLNQIRLSGAGTSSATPQVAGAAALWLQYNRKAIEADRAEDGRSAWNSWKKVEAVYTALLANADRPKVDKPDPYLGAGTLKALNALQDSYQDLPAKYPASMPAGRPPIFFGKVGADLLDGRKTLLALLTGPHKYLSKGERLHLSQSVEKARKRDEALHQIYFNFLLLREWHEAKTPHKGEKTKFERRAATRATTASR